MPVCLKHSQAPQLLSAPFVHFVHIHPVERHQKLLDRLEAGGRITENYVKVIQDATNRLVADETLRVLKTVPIEEINRDKRGIKTKPLRDCGYEMVADIAASSVYEIALESRLSIASEIIPSFAVIRLRQAFSISTLLSY